MMLRAHSYEGHGPPRDSRSSQFLMADWAGLGTVSTMKTCRANALHWDGCERGWGENGFKWVSNQ